MGLGVLYYDKSYNRSWQKIWDDIDDPIVFVSYCFEYGVSFTFMFVTGAIISICCLGFIFLALRDAILEIFAH